MTRDDLQRFRDIQDTCYDRVLDELRAGAKKTHWMWFVFPQLAGLGHSPMAMRYAIADEVEARRYLADPVLGTRLRECTRLLLNHAGKPVRDILGSPDDLKIRSCWTLFAISSENQEDRELFQRGLAGFCHSQMDPNTLALLGLTGREQ